MSDLPSRVSLRSWSSKDEAHLDSLLDADVDPLWREQFHGLHGPDGDGADWRRTRVAVDDRDTLIGCASIVNSPLHPTRFPCAIEVAPPWRRRGIGTGLLDAVKGLRANASHPLSTKVRASDTAAAAFLADQGGLVYQRCPAAVIDARDPLVQRWANTHSVVGRADLTELSREQLCEAFSAQYLWTHRPWSPVGDLTSLTAVAAAEMEELDRSLGAVCGMAAIWRRRCSRSARRPMSRWSPKPCMKQSPMVNAGWLRPLPSCFVPFANSAGVT
jgi:GNAT superfamily N-acetyltransferase